MPKQTIRPSFRKEALDQRRVLKMAESAHAYVRGSTETFYAWLNGKDVPKTLPEGPGVWICGDCHTGNLGPIADLKGKIDIQIRDLDQTVVGNPAHDLLRMGLSLAMAARSSDLPGVTTALIIEGMIEGYLHSLAGQDGKVRTDEIEPVEKVMKDSLKRKWRHLAEERIEDVTPCIPLGDKFWPLTNQERVGIKCLFEEEKERAFLKLLTGNKEFKNVELVDAAYWVKGCSSLGRVRYAALVRVGDRHRLIDIKAATKPLAPRCADSSLRVPINNAERVVMGACALSPFLGERTIATSLAGHQVIVRELRPQDVKFDLSIMTQREAVLTARLFASVVGKAHGRQMKPDVRAAWRKELRAGHTKSLDAPSWLWNSVVELVALHEASYLRHCRRFALSPAHQSK